MRVRSPSVSHVLEQLPARLARALDTADVAELVDGLVAAGWRPGQVAHRVGGEPAQGSLERDAVHVVEVLRALAAQIPPDVAHARGRQERERASRRAEPGPASPAVREAALASIRSGLKGLPSSRPVPPQRSRPACNLCGGEGSYFVTRQVHLCPRCVALLAAGEARLSAAG